jgi:hypothetical protein
MRARIVLCTTLALGACTSIVGGCASTPPPTPLARDFGVAHELAVFGQIANPAAEENLAPVEGIDGKIALGSYNRYRAGFGYSKEMDSSVFDIRPTQPAVSEVTYKDVSGGRTQGAVPNLPISVPK